jgi:hypothetical protein
MNDTRLKAGDRIRVHGWVMLRGLKDGEYLVKSVGNRYGYPTYSFVKPRGKHVVAVHFAATVDAWVRPAGHADLNRIEVLS